MHTINDDIHFQMIIKIISQHTIQFLTSFQAKHLKPS